MHRLARLALAAAFALSASAPAHAACADLWEWLNLGCRHVVDTYTGGRNAILLSGYSWHTPWTWTAEKRAEENSFAYGGGVARYREHPDSNTEIVYFLVFADSHKNAEFNLGYAWSTYWGERSGVQAGLGFTALIIQRPDIAGGWPFPAVLPLGSLRYDRATLFATYIPNVGGGVNNGSVFYFFGMVNLE